MPEINVYSGTRRVGVIDVFDEGELHFEYDPSWPRDQDAYPISLSMPDCSEVYRSPEIDNWLSNLLPEGETASILPRLLGLGDNLSILVEMGADTAGALSFGSPSDPEQWSYTPLVDFYDTTDQQTALPLHLQDAWRRPLLAGAEGVRSTLSGSQPKSVLTVLDADGRPVHRLPGPGDQLAIPMGGAPSTVVVKPDPESLPGLAENKAYCLRLAREIGLPAAEASILAAEGKKALCVLRFDRCAAASGEIERVHQEDFAQANGLPRSRKYEVGRVPGLTLSQLFETGRLLRDDGPERLLDQFIFRILVGDSDGHAKNFAALLRRDGPVLAPLYDCASALPYRHVNQTLPQRIAGDQIRPADMEPRHWAAIAALAGHEPVEVIDRVLELSGKIADSSDAVCDRLLGQEGVSAKDLKGVADAILKNIEGIRLRLS